MLPLRVGLSKVYCGENKFWHLEGHSSTTILIQGKTADTCCKIRFSLKYNLLRNVIVEKREQQLAVD